MRFISEIKSKSEVLAGVTVAVSAMFLVAGYEFVRSASFSLFKATYGVENLPTIIAISPLGILSILWLYGRTLDTFGPRRTLAITTLGSAFSILACYVLIKCDVRFATAVLFIIKEAYAVLLVEQFWSFINSVLKESEARRYNGLMLTISTLGGIAGGVLVHQFAQRLGTPQLVLVGGLLCFPCWYIAQRGYAISAYSEADHKSKKKEAKGFGFCLFLKNPVLFIILGMILLGQFYSYFIGLSFQEAIQMRYPNVDEQTAFSGLFFAITNSSSLFAQFVMTPLLLARVSTASIQISVPLINMLCMLGIWIFPGLESVSVAFLVFKSMEYSIFRASKEILYMPLSFDVRFRAKELIDVLGHRSGQGIASVLFSGLSQMGMIVHSSIPYLSLGILSVWFCAALPLWKRNSF